MKRAGRVYPNIYTLAEGYQNAAGAELLDAFAQTLGRDTLRDIPAVELAELKRDTEVFQALSEILWDALHPQRPIPDPKSVKHKYQVTYLTADGSLDSFAVTAYSVEQAAGFVMSGKCARTVGAKTILSVKPLI